MHLWKPKNINSDFNLKFINSSLGGLQNMIRYLLHPMDTKGGRGSGNCQWTLRGEGVQGIASGH